jgi:hypothetical protein
VIASLLQTPGAIVSSGMRAERALRHRATESASAVALGAVDAFLESRFARDAIDRVVASSLTRYAVERAMAEPLNAALESPATDEIAGRVLDSAAAERLFDRVIDRVRDSDELWALIDEVVRSPAVTSAISQQGLGLADQFAAVVRTRSGRADDRVERAISRLLRRHDDNGPAPALDDAS